jgi:hypothetical protein
MAEKKCDDCGGSGLLNHYLWCETGHERLREAYLKMRDRDRCKGKAIKEHCVKLCKEPRTICAEDPCCQLLPYRGRFPRR